MRKALFIALLALFVAPPAFSQFSRIETITLLNNNNTVAQTFAGPFSIKVGAACTWSVTGTVATINCAGGGGGVTTVNGLSGALTLAAGTNITIVPAGNTLTINSTGIGGTIAAGQLAGGSGANTIGPVGMAPWQFAQDGTSDLDCYADPGCGIELVEGAPMVSPQTFIFPNSIGLSDGVTSFITQVAGGLLQLGAPQLGVNTTGQLVSGLAIGTAPFLVTSTTLVANLHAATANSSATVTGLTPTTCTNQFVTAISATGNGTCTTDVLASAQHANQGTTTTVLHGNAAGNPSFGAVSLATDVTGQLPIAAVGSAGLSATSPITIAATGVIACATCQVAGGAVTATTYSTATNCADSAGAAACGSAAAGAFVVDAAATTVVVSTTAVTANSEIFVQYDSSLGTRLGITCNTTVALPSVTARTAGVSFTVTVPVAPITNPSCYNFFALN